VQKLRLTGGEPLVRRDLYRLVAMLAELPVEITLTTNGSLLAKQAKALKAAGLHRVTVSLDSLDDATFRAMNDADFPVAKVICAEAPADGRRAARAARSLPAGGDARRAASRNYTDHQRLSARQAGQGVEGGGPASRHREPGFAGRRHFPRDERCGFPGGEGHRC